MDYKKKEKKRLRTPHQANHLQWTNTVSLIFYQPWREFNNFCLSEFHSWNTFDRYLNLASFLLAVSRKSFISIICFGCGKIIKKLLH